MESQIIELDLEEPVGNSGRVLTDLISVNDICWYEFSCRVRSIVEICRRLSPCSLPLFPPLPLTPEVCQTEGPAQFESSGARLRGTTNNLRDLDTFEHRVGIFGLFLWPLLARGGGCLLFVPGLFVHYSFVETLPLNSLKKESQDLQPSHLLAWHGQRTRTERQLSAQRLPGV